MKALALCLLFVFSVWARPFSPLDLVQMQRVGDPEVSPKGDRYAFNVQAWDMESNIKTTNLWYGSTKPGSAVNIVENVTGVTDYAYQWTSDGNSLLFLSSRSGFVQLWGVQMPSTGPGKSYQISNFPVDIDNLKLSHDGKFVAFSAQVYPGFTMQQTADKDAVNAKSRVNAQTWDHLFIRRWDTYWLGKFNHVFYAPISFDSSKNMWSIGTAQDIMFYYSSDCPSRPFGGPEEFDFSFDNTEIAFTTQVGKDIAWSTDLNVYTVVLSSMLITCLTCDNPATDTQPAYSPDGKYIAYLSMVIPQYESDRLRLKLFDRKTKAINTITPDWERSPGSMQWQSDSSAIWSIVGDVSRQRIYKIDVPSGKPTAIVSDHTNSGINLLACSDNPLKTCLLFAQQNFMRPTDIYQTLASGSTTQMTSFNQARLNEIEFSTPEEYHFTGADGDDVMGWMFKPYGYVEGQSYPIVYYIHGGPEDAWFDEFHYRWNPQTITAAGYGLFAPNLHGSSTFGDAFCQSILQQWGGRPFQDVMKAYDAVPSSFAWVDKARSAAMGASYGGFLINWINSQTTVFKCLICHDGVFDPMGEYYYTDELYFDEMEFGYAPFVNRTFYDKWSPMAYAANIVTPQLTIHGGKDFRIPDVSGISVFTLLQRKGIPSILIRFPNENHWVMDPNDSIYWHDQVLMWLHRWLDE